MTFCFHGIGSYCRLTVDGIRHCVCPPIAQSQPPTAPDVVGAMGWPCETSLSQSRTMSSGASCLHHSNSANPSLSSCKNKAIASYSYQLHNEGVAKQLVASLLFGFSWSLAIGAAKHLEKLTATLLAHQTHCALYKINNTTSGFDSCFRFQIRFSFFFSTYPAYIHPLLLSIFIFMDALQALSPSLLSTWIHFALSNDF